MNNIIKTETYYNLYYEDAFIKISIKKAKFYMLHTFYI